MRCDTDETGGAFPESPGRDCPHMIAGEAGGVVGWRRNIFNSFKEAQTRSTSVG